MPRKSQDTGISPDKFDQPPVPGEHHPVFATHPPFAASRRRVYAVILFLVLAVTVTVIVVLSTLVIKLERYEEVEKEVIQQEFGNVALSECKQGKRRVMNGACVPEGEYKQVGFICIQEPGSDAYACTGVLIARSWVLSAAHCVPTLAGATAIVKLGCTDVYDDACREHAVEKMIPHPCYALPGNHLADILLLKLKNSVTTNIKPYPVNGVTVPRLPAPGPQIDTVGVGFGYMDGDEQVCFLHSAWARAVTPNACPDFLGYPSHFPPICVLETEETGPHVCKGDSGGPLFVALDPNQTVYGVLSYGNRKPGIDCILNPNEAECCVTAPRLVGYADVAASAEWIRGVMDDSVDSTTCVVF